MVRNNVARLARIPTIHTVVLLITWLIDAAASGCPPARPAAGRPEGGRRRRRCQAGSGGMSLIAGCLLRVQVVRCGGGPGRARNLTSFRGERAAGCQRARRLPPAGRPPSRGCAGGRVTPALTEIRFPAAFSRGPPINRREDRCGW